MSHSLKGKVAIITGSTSGIGLGRAIAAQAIFENEAFKPLNSDITIH